MSFPQDPDRAFERRQADENQRYESERQADRLADYAPNAPDPCHQAPRVSTAMCLLAREVLNGDRGNAGEALARLVLEAVGE